MPARKKGVARRAPRSPKAAPDADSALEPLRQAPELWQSLFENSPDLVLIVDRERRVSYVNRVPAHLARRDVVGGSVFDLLAPAHRAAAETVLDRVFRTARPAIREFPAAGPANAATLYEARVLPIVRQGRVGAVLLTAVDVTERRWGETLQKATQRISEAALTVPGLPELFGAIHGIVGELMPAGNFYIALYDAEHDLVSFPYYVDEVDREYPLPKRPGKGLTEYVLRTGRGILVTPEVQAKLEAQGEVELIGAPSIDWLGVPLVTGGKTIGVLAVQTYSEGLRLGETELSVLRFVSTQIAMAIERKRAADALRDSESRLRALESATTEAILLHENGRIVEVNDAFVRLFGYDDLRQVIGRSILDFGTAEGRVRVLEAIRDGRVTAYEAEGLRKDGSAFVAELSARMAQYRGRPIRMVAIRDVTQRKRAEEALKSSERIFRAVISSVPIVLFAWDPQGTFVLSEGKGLETLGLKPGELVGRSVFDVYRDHPEILADARRALAGEAFRTTAIVGAAHFELWYSPVRDERGAVTTVIGVAADVSTRVALEGQLRQVQKMEAVGRLAGGIAHDFNNLLTAILSYVDFLLVSLGPEHPARDDAEEVRRAALKAADLTRQLLAFSRRQVLQPRLLDLNAIVREMEKLLRRLIGEDVALETSLARDIGLVRADPSQLEQVVVNLAVNARDAMPEGGTLSIETGGADADEVRAHGRAAVEPGRYVMLRIRDSGQGMDAETRSRLFEPFFTTKEQGRGTGLGLATVYGIVKQSGGYIWVDSETGRGTTFTIHLPRFAPSAAPVAPPDAGDSPPARGDGA
ncbi:MAG TPA: PAS domain S-box protein [Gemmatimonadales bacterium]|nr:PAS domain S-box protein [Gemmatimonadales bacterium]